MPEEFYIQKAGKQENIMVLAQPTRPLVSVEATVRGYEQGVPDTKGFFRLYRVSYDEGIATVSAIVGSVLVKRAIVKDILEFIEQNTARWREMEKNDETTYSQRQAIERYKLLRVVFNVWQIM